MTSAARAGSPLPATLVGLRQAIVAGDLSVAEALQAQQQHISTADAGLNSVVHLHQDQPPPPPSWPLAGVGLAHKDIFSHRLRQALCGWHRAPHTQAQPPASALRRLEAAGSANLAALSMAEFASGATGDNPNQPQTFNPLNADAVVGGSSSGSAVAVAAGLCYASLGTDTAGSVRIPAATCGVFGFKPSRGRIARDGTFPLAPSLDAIGVLARSAGDAAAIMAALGEARSSASWTAAPRAWRVRCALAADSLAPQVGDALEVFASRLGRHGSLRAGATPELGAIDAHAQVLLHVEASRVHLERLRSQPKALAVTTRSIAAPGVVIPPAWYGAALARREAFSRDFMDNFLQDADVLLLPALARPVPDWSQVHRGSERFEAAELLALHRWMLFANYLDLPAAVLPVGVDARGMPICVQVVARRDDDATLLNFCQWLEQHGLAPQGLPHVAQPLLPS
jgi:Asp-tRNA(Asn)/Glu-tRNA(Gln) amidotransferase A subunit family amidase